MNNKIIQQALFYTLFTGLLFISMCSGKSTQPEQSITPSPKMSKPRLIKTIPHDENSFTQGLVYSNGKLFESAGIYEKSSLRVLDTNGITITIHPIGNQFFGEGCALFKNKLFQITWQEKTCLVYSLPNLQCIDKIQYSGEGWGLTTTRSHLIMSNGSDTLYFRNEQFDITKKLPVTISQKPLTNLNELEFAQEYIYANVWFSDYIFKIDPQSGKAQEVIDCSEIIALEKPSADQSVLNGIAYNPETNYFYITGKNWKNLFIVEFP